MAPQKKYICAFCARAFSRSEHKQRHERSHTNEKPFRCLHCTSAFVRRDLLQRHCRTVHNLNRALSANIRKKESSSYITSPVSPEEDGIEDQSRPERSVGALLSSYRQRMDRDQLKPLTPMTFTSQPFPEDRYSPDNTLHAHFNPEHAKKVFATTAEIILNQKEAASSPTSTQQAINHGPATTVANSLLLQRNKMAPLHIPDFSAQMGRKIINRLELSKKLNVVISNFEKISILQSGNVQRIQFLTQNFSVTFATDLNLNKPLSDYFLSWNLLKKFDLPIFETLANEIDDFIDSFSGPTSDPFIIELYSKFDATLQQWNFSASDNQKVLNIDCNVCMLYAILAIGAANYDNVADCIQLFMRSWNLLSSNLIPRLNDYTNSFNTLDSKSPNAMSLDNTSATVSSSSGSSTLSPFSSEIVRDQIQILKNLFVLSFVSLTLDLHLKDFNGNNLSEEVVFNYLDDVSYILMSHLEEALKEASVLVNKSVKSSRNSSSSSLHSAGSEAHSSPVSKSTLPSTMVRERSLINDNLDLFWSIYTILSNYFMVHNHAPPKIYKFLLKKSLNGTQTLLSIMEKLTKCTVSSKSNFHNEVISLTVSNELQFHIHGSSRKCVYKLTSLMHNAIVFANRSRNGNTLESDTRDLYVFETFKQKLILNSPTRYQGMFNDFIFNPANSFNWNLLYIALKEFNLQNYTPESELNEKFIVASSKFKFNAFFSIFFHDFDIRSDVEMEIENNDHFKKEQYLQFVKYVIPFYTKGGSQTDENDKVDDLASHPTKTNQTLPDGFSECKSTQNNLGIISLPILFNHQFIKNNPKSLHWATLSQLSNFEKKRFYRLFLEWYMTMVKLIIGLKADETVYISHSANDNKNNMTHNRSELQDSVESISYHIGTEARASPNGKTKVDNSLSHNYVFQSLIYLILETECTVKLPGGDPVLLSEYRDNLNFEINDYKITDEIIYCLLRSVDKIMEDWIQMVNTKGPDILNSNGFKNLRKFVNEYIYSQLSTDNVSIEPKFYRIAHRNLVGGVNSTFMNDQYMHDGLGAPASAVAQTRPLRQPPSTHIILHNSDTQAPPRQSGFAQQFLHLDTAQSIVGISQRAHVPILVTKLYTGGIDQFSLLLAFNDVILPPILPPLLHTHNFGTTGTHRPHRESPR